MTIDSISLHKLRVYREVVERQSLTLAAQQLIVSQPVVSAHVRDLEAFCGARLLHQQGRRMLPTEAGEAVYRYAIEVLRATEETVSLVRALETGVAGRIAVGANMAPGTYRLPTQLTAFKLRHPKVEIDLLMSDSANVYEQTHRGENDFAVVAALEPPVGLHAEVLSQESLVICASPDHPLAGTGPVSLEALAQQKFVCAPFGQGRSQLMDSKFRELGLPNRRLEMTIGHPEGIKRAVRDGIGIALLFRCSLEQELCSGELVELPIAGRVLSHPFYLIHNARKRFSPAQQQLLDFLRRDASEGRTA